MGSSWLSCSESDGAWKKTTNKVAEKVNGWVNLTHIFATMRQIDTPVKRVAAPSMDLTHVAVVFFLRRTVGTRIAVAFSKTRLRRRARCAVLAPFCS